MSNFIAKIFIADFLSNFKVSEFEHDLEPGELGLQRYFAYLKLFLLIWNLNTLNGNILSANYFMDNLLESASTDSETRRVV